MDTFKKHRPARDSAYMRWVHAHHGGAPCCVCGAARWDQLHHFGPGRGMGIKGSDYLVCRVCRACHDRNDVRDGARVTGDRVQILLAMHRDALALLDAYLQAGPRPPLAALRDAVRKSAAHRCAVAELQEWLCTAADGATTPAAMTRWLLAWADRRAAALIDELIEEDTDGEE